MFDDVCRGFGNLNAGLKRRANSRRFAHACRTMTPGSATRPSFSEFFPTAPSHNRETHLIRKNQWSLRSKSSKPIVSFTARAFPADTNAIWKQDGKPIE
jgi:hypothetical protein